MELPPRARRIRHRAMAAFKQDGTTSACAENTLPFNAEGETARNYLRVRGEYPQVPSQRSTSWELPPRARRIPSGLGVGLFTWGTTSACAENTLSPAG